MDFAINSALWVVSKALDPITNGLLESWSASTELGCNIDALKMELLYAQGMLDNAQGRDIRSPALRELLLMLQELAYGADDALDELDYFRIQDALDGTYHTADLDAQGYVDGLLINARHTARAATKPYSRSRHDDDASRGDPGDQDNGGKQGCFSVIRSCGGHEIRSPPSSPANRGVQVAQGGCMPKVVACARGAAETIGKHFPCYSSPLVRDDDTQIYMSESPDMAVSGRQFLCCTRPRLNKAQQKNRATQAQKMEFYRVEMSKKIKEIVERLKPLCAKVSTILDKELLSSVILKLDLLDPSRAPNQHNVIDRPKTTPQIVEPELYGRNEQKKKIVDSITRVDELTVLPLVGPGGVGKTTLTQHICREVESSFDVSVWVCVSLDFNADRLAQEIMQKIPEVKGESKNSSVVELIQQRLKSKRLLLVLDDMWTYREDEWEKLISPLRYTGREKGNVVIVTTRIPEVASMVRTANSSINDVGRLGPRDIMSFFELCVFGYQQPWENHPELRDVGSQIVTNLKGFPLAAKTVGRLLRNKLTRDHWTRVAESREWELQTGPTDIMPALKLSYDYLPYHLQKCFSCCALFPEDYEFGSKELVRLWIGLDILHSRGENERKEDVGLYYLDDLVNHGFFKKIENGPFYVIHDLLHELAVKVSTNESLSICSSNVRSMHIPLSVRHLSIIVDDTDVSDIMHFEEYQNDLTALVNDKRPRFQNLRTLMLFGEYHGSFAKQFKDLLKDALALRTIFMSGVSYSVEDVLPNFSELVHLRYLRIKSVCNNKDMCLPSSLLISYHLQVIDLENWGGSFCSTSDMSNLVNLRHFVVPENDVELHSSICKVGKLKFLDELRLFEVGKHTEGFELSQLGELTGLGGSLAINNLEKVQVNDKAKELKLKHKKHIHKLVLKWANKDPPQDQNIIENLAPHENLQDLCIEGHGGTNCPSWLGRQLSLTNLVSLSLRDISWNKLPPLGGMWFVGDLGVECQGLSSTLSFQCLKTLQLVKIPGLKKWVGNGTCHLFSHLEVIGIEDCPELVELPFSHPACYQAEQEANMIWFPKLQDLKIIDCPKLSSLPPIPWTPSPCYVEISDVGCEFKNVCYSLDDEKELYLGIEGKGGQNGTLWNVLDFHNLADLKVLYMSNCPPMPLILLQKLKSLKTLSITRMSTVLSLCEGESHSIGCPLPVEYINIEVCDANGEELTQLLSYLPKLTELYISGCEKITALGVVEHQPTVVAAIPAPSPSSSANNKSEHAQDGHNPQQTRGKDEIASATQGLLLLPPQLQDLKIWRCADLRLLSNSLGNDSVRGGLQSLCSLRSLEIVDCPKFLLSFLSSASSCFPFPASLQNLTLRGVESMETLACLSNLISLTGLNIYGCQDLRDEGLWPLVAQGHLTELDIFGIPKFFTDSELLLPHDEERRSCSSKLKSLCTDDLAGVLTLPICSLLSSSLTKLIFIVDKEVERFTEEQDEALHLLNSLQELEFWHCEKLERLPAGLTKLTNLKRLQIWNSPAIQLLPKDRLPNSLQELEIRDCPAIKSLPKEWLPSSLRRLEVTGDISEELKSQCRKLKGTIPIIKDYRY